MTETTYLTAEEATALLGITPATLYSYVSRGLVRSEPVAAGTRRRRYLAADVLALRQRRERRRDPATVAAAALDFGEPVLDSAISLIQAGRLYYRGRDAVPLAQQVPFEAVAHWLWDGVLETTLFDQAEPLPPALMALRAWTESPPLAACPPLERLQAVLPLAAEYDLSAHDLSRPAVMRTGVRLLHFATRILCGAATAPTIAQALAQHWQIDPVTGARLLDACLILAADHELNASSFTARCVASTGATPYAAVAAALAALQGPRHGGQTLRCEAFLREAEGDGRRAVLNRLKLGEPIPGFGHRLYPDGDPRGRFLLDAALAVAPDAPAAALLRAVSDATMQSLGLQPTLDFGLVAVARMLGLPAGTPLLLFALGRLAGWIGHILEQVDTGHLIRPRARYTGPAPDARLDRL